MSLALVGIGVALLAMPWLLRDLGRRASPHVWARWCLHAGWLGYATLVTGLVTTAAPTVLRASGVRTLAEACERVLVPLQPGGAPMAWLALTIAAWLAVAATIGARQARRTQQAGVVERGIGDHRHRAGFDVVVIPSDQPVAYSVAGSRQQVVLTAGLLDRLDDDQVELVVGHELAHLRRGHPLSLRLAVALEAALGPLARATTGELRLAIERAADEDAAGTDSSRRRGLRGALLTSAGLPAGALTTLSPVAAMAERVDALQHPPARPSPLQRVGLHAPACVLTLAALVALGDWTGHVGHMIAMAGRCPI